MEVTAEQFEAASRRMENQRVRYSTIAAVHYSADRDRLVIDLSNGLALSFPPQLAQVLQHATAEDLAETEITASELSVYFPRMDVSLYVPGLLDGLFGTREWMRKEFAQMGGRSTSEAKAAAARANGKRGGRPRKNKTAA